jgi:hypothetical protein
MSNKPTKASVHVDGSLTNLSVAYVQSQDAFVADKVFPIVPVEHASDEYFIFNMGDFQRDEAKDRAPATESAGGDYGLTTGTYSCKIKAFHKDVPEQVRANADMAVDPDRAATEYVTQKMLIAKEKQFVSSFMATSLWGYQRIGDANGSVGSGEVCHWSDYTNSDPILDVENAATAIQAKTGFRPNKLVLGRRVFNTLKNHPDFMDRIKGGATPQQAAILARQTMAAIFEVDEVLVMDAVENTAKEGQTASSDFIGGKNALLVYAAPRPGIMTPSAGYTFSWTRYLGASAMGIAISKFEMRNLKADRVEGEIAFDQKLVASDLGAYFSGIIA